MEFKVCSKCGEEFPATTEFFNKGNGKFNLRSQCKDCQRKWRYKYRQTDRAKELEKAAGKRYKKSEKGKAAHKRYDQSTKGRATQKRWHDSEKGKAANIRYKQSEKGKESKRILNRKFQQTKKGKEIAARAHKKYFQTERGKRIIREVNRKHYENNKLSSCVSRRMRKSLGDNKSGRHWEDLVGYTLEQLKAHIESLFQLGMSWDNYGLYGWHIDHKVPVSAFNITSYTCEDFQKCWTLENLQPLWAGDNIRKSNKMEEKECF